MKFNSRLLLQFLLLLLTATVFTSAVTCKKLILSDGPTGNVGASRDDIMETGRYTVRTTQKTDSRSVKDLLNELDGARDIEYHLMWFTAILEPKDLKKVAMRCSM